MTTPRTPTGRALDENHALGVINVHEAILAIEVEAAAQERASLLIEHCAGHDDTTGPCETCTLLEAKP